MTVFILSMAASTTNCFEHRPVKPMELVDPSAYIAKTCWAKDTFTRAFQMAKASSSPYQNVITICNLMATVKLNS